MATAIERLRRAVLDGQFRIPEGTTPRDLDRPSESIETTREVRVIASAFVLDKDTWLFSNDAVTQARPRCCVCPAALFR